jgi:hypothetical protein
VTYVNTVLLMNLFAFISNNLASCYLSVLSGLYVN